MTAPFVAMSVDAVRELRLERLLQAFPGDEIAGRRDPTADPYISPAQLKTASRCLEQYRLRYVKGEKERPASALLWGSADHAATEWAFKEKIVSKENPSPGHLAEFFRADLGRRVEEEANGWENVELKKDETPADVIDRGAKLIELYGEVTIPALDPLAIEERFEIAVPGVPVPIRGAIDLEAMAPVPEQAPFGRARTIVDKKTSGRRQLSREWLIQARTYQLYKPLVLEFQLALKTKTPAIEAHNPEYRFTPQPAAMTIAFAQRVVTMIASAFETFGPDEPWPGTAFGGFGDTCGYCGWGPNAAATCPWFNTGRWGA